MIASKQIAFGCGGKRKPYDAEIEYLESTGTQYIDLGLNSTVDKFCDFDISFKKTGLDDGPLIGDYSAPFGYRYAANARYGIWGGTVGSDLNLYVGVDSANRITIVKDTEWHHVKVRNGQYIEVDGVQTSVESGTVRANINILLFATVTSVSGATSWINVPGIVSEFRIWDTSGNLLRDLIPVRKGNIGYMYDRVSGQLFGNQGTGEFVLGPDIIDYTAKDYIQDGLVAMWDGIENAGWGVHDPDLPVGEWKNLGGGAVTLDTASPAVEEIWAWTSDGAKVVDVSRANQQVLVFRVSVDPTDDDFTLDYCVAGATSSMTNFYVIQYGLGTFRFYKRGTTTGIYAGGFGSFTIDPSGPVNACVVSRPSAPITLGYSNGALAQSHDSAVDGGGQTFMRFSLLGSGFCRIDGSEVKCFRIYNRALTAEEIAHNYEIDKARFGL